MIELYEDKDGQWRYRIKGGNGEIMNTSEPYDSKSNARRGYIQLRELLSGPPLPVRVVR